MALDRDLVEEQGVGLGREIRRHYREQSREAILVVCKRIAERRAGRPRLGANDQVDVRDLVAIADQRLTEKEVRCHVEELLSEMCE